jgi:2-polyprenyl-6-methoxyphenol hydroxylase-like FAD-dependent oxidoreductase
MFDEVLADTFVRSVEKLLQMVPSTLKWKLMDRAPLNKWVHREGRVALLGDACHPMLVGILRCFPRNGKT